MGWNLGDIREMGGGAIDLGKGAGRKAMGRDFDLSPRASYLLALPLLIGIYGAVVTYLLTGRMPEELRDYYYPPDGQGGRVSMPSYIKEIVSVVHDPVVWAKAKIHPLLTLIADMLSNKDYFGRPIANPDDPIVERALDRAKHVATAFEPISVQGLERNAGEPLKQQVLPFIGFPRAPKYIDDVGGAGSGSADLLTRPAARRPRDAEFDRLRGR